MIVRGGVTSNGRYKSQLSIIELLEQDLDKYAMFYHTGLHLS